MEDAQRQHLAHQVKTRRLARDWSAAELGYAAGVSAKTISRLENAHVEHPRNATIRALAKALGAKPADLTGPRPSQDELEQDAQDQLDQMQETLKRIDDAVKQILAAEMAREVKDAQAAPSGAGDAGDAAGSSA